MDLYQEIAETRVKASGPTQFTVPLELDRNNRRLIHNLNKKFPVSHCMTRNIVIRKLSEAKYFTIGTTPCGGDFMMLR